MSCNLHEKDSAKKNITWSKKSFIKRSRAIELLEWEYKFLRKAAGNWAANWIFKTYSENQNASDRRADRELSDEDIPQLQSKPKALPSRRSVSQSSRPMASRKTMSMDFAASRRRRATGRDVDGDVGTCFS